MKNGQQLYVNNKWFFDVSNIEGDKLTIRIKYKESSDRQYYLYKNILLDKNMFTDVKDMIDYVSCKIDEKKLKSIIGSLINLLIKEKNPYSIKEDASANVSNTAGMGAVSQPGLSGIAGVPGTAGSGDINVGRKRTKQLMYTIPQTNSKIKKALLDIIGVKEDISIDVESDDDYKKKVFDFLDFPFDRDEEIDIIKEISKNRAYFLNISPVRIKDYFKDFFEINKSLINSKCSDNFINMFMILSEI